MSMANVLHWLLPKEEKFFEMLNDQCSNVVKGANEFKNLIDSYENASIAERKEFVKKIDEIERKGDDIAHKIIGGLDSTFITPIDKEDIHKLAVLLDDVIDIIDETSKRFILFKIDEINKHIRQLTEVVIEIIKKIEQGISEIKNLRNMNQFYIDTHTLENKGDEIYYNAIEELMDNKECIDVIRYKEIYEHLEQITDKCEDIANVIESVVVKHA